ncbi:MAG: hypothetical protein R3F43_13490 [bacterium]
MGIAGRGDLGREEAPDDLVGSARGGHPVDALPSSWTVGEAPVAKGAGIGGLVAAPPKHTMAEINEALTLVCGTAASCDPELNLQALPLREMASRSRWRCCRLAASGMWRRSGMR